MELLALSFLYQGGQLQKSVNTRSGGKLQNVGKQSTKLGRPTEKPDPLIVNEYGIPEPIKKKIVYPNILLVPLVAFDKNLNRIGYGGGFYDRYIKRISKIKKIFTIGLAYSFQQVKKIPINKYDIKLDYIITEKNN